MVVTCGICQVKFENDLIFTDHFLETHLSDKLDDDVHSLLTTENKIQTEKYPKLFKDVDQTITAFENARGQNLEVPSMASKQEITSEHKDVAKLLKTFNDPKLLKSFSDQNESLTAIKARLVKVKFLQPPQNVKSQISNVNRENFYVLKPALENKINNIAPTNEKKITLGKNISVASIIEKKIIKDNHAILKYERKIARNMLSKSSNGTLTSRKDILNAKYSELFQNACDICGHISVDTHKLASHIITHIGAMPYYCNPCSFSCISKLRFQQHLYCHGKEFCVGGKLCPNQRLWLYNTRNLHECDICKSSFQKWRDLVLHYVQHILNMPFKCHQCKMYFVNIKDFTIHSHIHKPSTTCQICTMYFKTKPQLLDHVLEHDKFKLFRKFHHIGWNDGLSFMQDPFSVLRIVDSVVSMQKAVWIREINMLDKNNSEIKDKNKLTTYFCLKCDSTKDFSKCDLSNLMSKEIIYYEKGEDVQHLCDIVFNELQEGDEEFEEFNSKCKVNCSCIACSKKTSPVSEIENISEEFKKSSPKKSKIIPMINKDKKKKLSRTSGCQSHNKNKLNIKSKSLIMKERKSNISEDSASKSAKKRYKRNYSKINSSMAIGIENKLSSALDSSTPEKNNHAREKIVSKILKSKKMQAKKYMSRSTATKCSDTNPYQTINSECLNLNNKTDLISASLNIKKPYVLVEKLPEDVQDFKSYRRYKDKLRYRLKRAKIEKKRRRYRMRYLLKKLKSGPKTTQEGHSSNLRVKERNNTVSNEPMKLRSRNISTNDTTSSLWNKIKNIKKCCNETEPHVEASSSECKNTTETKKVMSKSQFISLGSVCDFAKKCYDESLESCSRTNQPSSNIVLTSEMLEDCLNSSKAANQERVYEVVNKKQNCNLSNQYEIINHDHNYQVNNEINADPLKDNSNTLKIPTRKVNFSFMKKVSKTWPKTKSSFFEKSLKQISNRRDSLSNHLRTLMSRAKSQKAYVSLIKLPNYIYEKHLKMKPIMLSNILPLISTVESVGPIKNIFNDQSYEFLLDHNYSNFVFSSTKEQDIYKYESDSESTVSGNSGL